MPTDKGKILLPIARAAIAHALHRPFTADESADWLLEHGACFVTLTRHGALRGCIGSLQAHRTLLADVKGNAVYAAFHDPRFLPLTTKEFADTRIEISLLTAPMAMEFNNEADALSQLKPGLDGVIFEFSSYRSTFLPQVWEQLPDPHVFMAHLKRKAGLSADFWDDQIRLSRYSVSKFEESNDHSQEQSNG
jgi:AmmeMemoRadiSam system protein A